MAEAVRIVAALYKDGVIKRAKDAPAFPDVLSFHETGTVIEQRLFGMLMEHRMRAFQGAFHNNPDYSTWYGWSELKQDLTEIRERAEEMRCAAKKG